MNDWGIIGHDWAVRRLRSAIERNQLAQSHLFVGSPHVGKAALAKATARALIGQDERSRALVDSLKHPDLAWLEPDGDTIKVEPIRDLLHTLSLAPVESKHRVAVVNDSQLMTEGGKNAILKTLEEPNARVVMILTAPSVESVLPTISSRCQVLNLRVVAITEIQSALLARGVDETRAQFIARLSGGRPGWAFRVLQDETLMQERDQRLNDLKELLASNRTKRFAYAEKLARKDSGEIRETLNEWMLFWRDVCQAERSNVIRNIDHYSYIQALSESVSPAAIREVMNELSESAKNLQRNVNPRLALDTLLLSLPTL
jgi:DNA polymerase-3 subunit delta'